MRARALRALLVAVLRDRFRFRFVRLRVLGPNSSALRWEVVLGWATAIVGLGVCGFAGGGFVAASLDQATLRSPEVAAAGGILLLLSAVWPGILAAIALLFIVGEGVESGIPLPVPRRWLVAPDIVIGLADSMVWYLVLIAPGTFFLGGLMGHAFPGCLRLVLSHGALFVIVVATVLLAVAGVVRLLGPYSSAVAPMTAAVVGGGGAVALAMTAGRLATGDLAHIVARIGSSARDCVGEWTVAVIPVLASTQWGIVLITAAVIGSAVASGGVSHLLAGAADQRWIKGERRRPLFPKSSRPVGQMYSSLLGPFLRMEVTALRRDPWRAARDLLGTVVCLAALLVVFPGKSDAISATILFFIPISLCGALLLHGVGRDGTLVDLVVLAGRTRSYLRAKMIAGLVVVGGLSFLAAVLVGFFSGSWVSLGAGRGGLFLIVLLPLAVVFGVTLALGLGSLFADRRVKRLTPGRGVGLGAELVFWLTGGMLAVSLYLTWRGFSAAQPTHAVGGILLVLLFAIGLAALVRFGEQALARAE